MRNINLKGTEHFEAVARLGSVTKAAEELGVTPSAISQQIKLLETQFGVRLFRREKRRMSLTEEGDRLFQATTRAFAALRNTGNAISRHREVRNLTLRVSPSFGVRWLGPRIASFAEQNLDWNIRVDATPDFSNFDTDAVDLDLRYGVGGWAGVAERLVMNDLVLPLCAPGYRDRMAAAGDTVAERLSAARLIDSVKAMFRWDLWLAANQVELEDYDYPFRYDRSSMSIETAKQGAGLALDSATLCLPDLERGELVPAFPDIPVVDFPAYWLVCPARHFNRRIVNRFAEWLDDAAISHDVRARALLESHGCSFQTESGPDLIEVEPWGLSRS